jgi:pyruvate/2-oxoglutarate/acetoin dehydrogenase E1 component/TPP-dependent pyruvate/acetoin dehydrogenase alpha subunit
VNVPILSPYNADSVEASLRFSRDAVLRDYRVAHRSRQASIVGRREVFAGNAKFGIFGDGKEVAQIAMAYAFRRGDFRSGYYRDQTFMFALGMTTIDHFFAQLYAHADLAAEPAFGGRSMTGHFATRLLDPQGRWKNLTAEYNSSADLSPTAAQMPRLVGLAYASKLYRQLESLGTTAPGFSEHGDEIALGTIGNASCAEGMFWEAVNAAGVLQIPMLLSIWDDGYGISVPNKLQMTKGDISAILAGFRRRPGGRPGLDISSVRGWNYPELCDTYLSVAELVRREHIPAIVHVTELTQPLGHSTSGSQSRYKPPERLAWEKEFDCLAKMREWIVAEELATTAELDVIEAEELDGVREARDRAWRAYRAPIEAERGAVLSILRELEGGSARRAELEPLRQSLEAQEQALRRDLLATAEEALVVVREEPSDARRRLAEWKERERRTVQPLYSSDLYSETAEAALEVTEVEPVYLGDSPVLSGFEILNACFDAAFERYPHLIALGEDVGRLGDVNQGLAELQEKYSDLRVSDTGIREATIVGQAIGMALRGLRPIAEIQYLDYLLYAIQILSDDLASLRWRTRGGQKAPVIIRTRGHRLEGIWHSGSPMAGIINLLRGIYVCVPRNSTQAAGLYNTLLRSDDAALMVEVLNGYRRKERLPANIGDFTIPLGVPEVLRTGSHVTVVTYGACCQVAQSAAELLSRAGIEIELIDVRTLLPFDRHGSIVASLRKTNRVLFLDEDYPGGTTAYMMQQVLERAGGYAWLDVEPRTLSAPDHRPAYGSDGDYFSKPNREQIFEAVYELMNRSDPARFPIFYR